MVPVPHWPGPGCVNENTVLAFEPQSFAVTRHQICVLSGRAAVGWNDVVVTVCEITMLPNAASVAISIRYDDACAAGFQVNTGCSGVEFAPFTGESSVGAFSRQREERQRKSIDLVIAPEVPVTVTV